MADLVHSIIIISHNIPQLVVIYSVVQQDECRLEYLKIVKVPKEGFSDQCTPFLFLLWLLHDLQQ